MNIIKKSLAAGLMTIVAFLGAATAPANAVDSTVVVFGNTSAGENQPGWMFNRDLSTQTPYQFVDSNPKIGSGSLYVLPINNSINGNSDKFIGENFVNAKISNINTISYDFKIGSGGDSADKDHFYMNVYANFGESDDLKYFDCRYDVVPTAGSNANYTTVTFDPTQAYPVTTRGGASASPYTCPAIPADMDNLSPDSNIRMFAINLGDTSANDQGLNGYFDNVVVDLDSGKTTYDFEPNPYSVPQQCENIEGLGAPIVGTNKSEKINGTAGNDLIFGLGGSDKIDGKGGNDCIVGGDGSDKLVGGLGDDVILGGNLSDSLEGNDGDDKLYGEDGSDSLRGGNQNDMLWGGNGSDSLRGGNQDDTLDGGDNNDTARGESGDDTCNAEVEKTCEL